MRVLITGVAGFVGSALARSHQASGDETFRFDLPVFDVRRESDVFQAVRACKPDVVYHLAAQTEVRRSYDEPWDTYNTNFLGTLNVLEATRLLDVPSLVVASSDKAYCEAPTPYREDSPLGPGGDVYSASKRAADDLCHSYARTYGLPVKVLRCANTYGPGQRNETTLITATVKAVLDGRKPQVHDGMGVAIREWLYIDDAVAAYRNLAMLPAVRTDAACYGERAWNVGSGVVYTVNTVVRTILMLMKRPQDDVEIVPCDVEQLHVNCVDSSRYDTAFPGCRRTPLLDGLSKTIAWYKEHRA